MSIGGFSLKTKSTSRPATQAPLSAHARNVLLDVAYSPVPMLHINPGVTARLLRDALIEEAQLPSPFKTHAGKLIAFAKITPLGRLAVTPRCDQVAHDPK
jgi:hypothetical protein